VAAAFESSLSADPDDLAAQDVVAASPELQRANEILTTAFASAALDRRLREGAVFVVATAGGDAAVELAEEAIVEVALAAARRSSRARRRSWCCRMANRLA